MLSLSLSLSTVSVHFSTVPPRRSRGRVGIVRTVDGYTLRGCGVMLETRAVRSANAGDSPSAIVEFGRGLVFGAVLGALQFGPVLIGLEVLS
jgi:hypothetical protein